MGPEGIDLLCRTLCTTSVKVRKPKKRADRTLAPAIFIQSDPKKPKAVRIYVATSFPEWQDACVQIVRDTYDAEREKVDDAKVRELLIQKGMIKDKKAMPFIQAFKVRF